MRESKNTNKGFSLVEMLVAITILVIIVAPLTKVLVSSSKVNLKSKRVMSATEMAQNMFESIESKSPEEAIVELSSLVKSSDITLDKANSIIPGGMSYDDVSEYLSVGVDPVTGEERWETDTSGGGLFVQSIVYDTTTNKYRCKGFKKSTDDRYVFSVNGLKQEGTTYDVVVRLDASEYDTTYEPTVATDPLYATDYVSVPKIFNVNAAYDGVSMEGPLALNNVLSGEYYGKRINNGKVESEILKNMKRTYTIEIDDIGATGSPQIVANIKKTYDYQLSSDLVAGYNGVYEETPECVFDSTQYGSAPRNIFVYYTPNYNSTSTGDSALDQFVIKNSKDIDVNVYIVRMQQSGLEANNLANESTETREKLYAATVKIEESDDSVINTKIRTNLDDNIMKVNTISDYKYRAEDIARNSHLITYKINSLSPSATEAKLTNEKVVKGIDAQDDKARVYEVTIEVYMGKSSGQKGDNNGPVFYDGAAQFDFPEDAKLATFTGRITQ